MKKHLLAPSILAADFARLGEQVDAAIAGGADWLHIDVMDQHYVPNLTMGAMVCKSLRQYGIQVPLDVHLMASPVDQLINDFAAAGASTITIHPNATTHLDRSLQLIHQQGCQVGVALNPSESLDHLECILHRLDVLLLMSVNPGFCGQEFLPAVLSKIKAARRLIDYSDHSILLSVDGGINAENIGTVISAGADICVAGSAVFGQSDVAAAVHQLRTSIHEHAHQ